MMECMLAVGVGIGVGVEMVGLRRVREELIKK